MASNKNQIPFSEFAVGKVFDFGESSISEDEIISYAKQWDPLPFHTSVEGGENSMFRGLFSSGPQIFHIIHKEHWLRLFGHSVLCGLGVNNWKFKKPIYANKTIKSRITILDIEADNKRQRASVTWQYEFLNQYDEQYQCLDMTILHSMV